MADGSTASGRGTAAEPDAHAVTALLTRLGDGEGDALSSLIPLVYDELKVIARRQLRGLPSSATLEATDLVHEAFVKLTAGARPSWNDRCHFFAVAATAMRHLAVDHARRRSRRKRGGGQIALTLERFEIAAPEPAATVLALDEALHRLETLNPRLVKVVECRFFGGLTEGETAVTLSVSERTVRRDWVKARAWLHRELASG